MPVTIVRTIIIYIMIVLAMRLMGKRQLGELQPSELVSTILISNLASIPVESPEVPLAASALPVFLIVCMEIGISALGVRQQKVAKLMSGNQKIVIREGKIDQKALRDLRFTMDDLLEALRQKDVFSPEEVSLAMVETSGTISIYRYPHDTPVTKQDAGVKSSGPLQPPLPVIQNGMVYGEILTACGKDKHWLERALKARGVLESEVLLMLCTEQEEFTLVQKEPEQT